MAQNFVEKVQAVSAGWTPVGRSQPLTVAVTTTSGTLNLLEDRASIRTSTVMEIVTQPVNTPSTALAQGSLLQWNLPLGIPVVVKNSAVEFTVTNNALATGGVYNDLTILNHPFNWCQYQTWQCGPQVIQNITEAAPMYAFHLYTNYQQEYMKGAILGNTFIIDPYDVNFPVLSAALYAPCDGAPFEHISGGGLFTTSTQALTATTATIAAKADWLQSGTTWGSVGPLGITTPVLLRSTPTDKYPLLILHGTGASGATTAATFTMTVPLVGTILDQYSPNLALTPQWLLSFQLKGNSSIFFNVGSSTTTTGTAITTLVQCLLHSRCFVLSPQEMADQANRVYGGKGLDVWFINWVQQLFTNSSALVANTPYTYTLSSLGPNNVIALVLALRASTNVANTMRNSYDLGQTGTLAVNAGDGTPILQTVNANYYKYINAAQYFPANDSQRVCLNNPVLWIPHCESLSQSFAAQRNGGYPYVNTEALVIMPGVTSQTSLYQQTNITSQSTSVIQVTALIWSRINLSTNGNGATSVRYSQTA